MNELQRNKWKQRTDILIRFWVLDFALQYRGVYTGVEHRETDWRCTNFHEQQRKKYLLLKIYLQASEVKN